MAKCRACREWIVFRPTELGGLIPLDPLPNPDGDIVMRGPTGVPTVAHKLRHDEEPFEGEERYMPHSNTCKGSEVRRRRRRRSRSRVA